MILLAMGLGNVQGLGFLLSQGYRVPITAVTVTVGLNSMVNTLLGGHPATVARTGAAILAGPDAGPKEGRYWAALIAATLTISIALGADQAGNFHPYKTRRNYTGNGRGEICRETIQRQ